MYPGDINNNGVVNGTDVLYWGVAAGAEGPERAGATTDFTPQVITPWPQSFPGGLNFAYADVDGDGEIEDEDLGDDDGLEANFGLTHGIPSPDIESPLGTPGIDPLFRFEPDLAVATGGETVEVTFSLGQASTPVEQFYGLSFIVLYDPGVIDPGSIDFILPGSPWYDPGGSSTESVIVSELVPGRLEVAITRIDQVPVNGFGEVGTMKFVIIEDVVGAIMVDEQINIGPTLLADSQLTPLAIALEGQFPPTVSRLPPIPDDLAVKVYPNPTDEWVTLASNGSRIESVRIYSPLGEHSALVPAISGGATSAAASFSVAELPPGIYLLLIRVEGSWYRRMLCVQRE